MKSELYQAIQQQHLTLGVGAGAELVAQAIADLKVEKSAWTRQFIVRLIAQSAAAKEPQVRQALVAQAKFERAKQSPLLNDFARILTADEFAEVLR